MLSASIHCKEWDRILLQADVLALHMLVFLTDKIPKVQV